ncbi:MAG TPA: hypothetical protein VF461_15905 [Gemmatimonadaceae bacterium]
MTDTVPAALVGWESYYVIVGSSAAALTGLQFVVIALINDLHTRASGDTLGAFGTPTVVHFCVALLTASILSAPWATLSSPAIALGVTGLGGLLYAAIVIRRARRQKDYKPVAEDWLFHTILPVVAYSSIVGGGLALVTHSGGAMFAIAAATLLLVFIGIHNAWDTVTWITTTRRGEATESATRAEAGASSNGAPAKREETAAT